MEQIQDSKGIISVQLNDIQINAPIGLYDEERIKGNDFSIDIAVKMPYVSIEEIPFLDYEPLHAIVLESMSQEEKLLETVARNILLKISAIAPTKSRIFISIKKKNPPLKGVIDNSCVTLEWYNT